MLFAQLMSIQQKRLMSICKPSGQCHLKQNSIVTIIAKFTIYSKICWQKQRVQLVWKSKRGQCELAADLLLREHYIEEAHDMQCAAIANGSVKGDSCLKIPNSLDVAFKKLEGGDQPLNS
jgi:hypothetical protein